MESGSTSGEEVNLGVRVSLGVGEVLDVDLGNKLRLASAAVIERGSVKMKKSFHAID